VVAESYARIFYRNTVNGGYVVPFETANRLVEQFATGDTVTIDTEKYTLTNARTGKTFTLQSLGDVGPIIQAGGIFEYAKKEGIR
jgi:3-isopropylmalate/(R)-2-methylmalate dehydratase small subunit